jgi:hypothetical protein
VSDEPDIEWPVLAFHEAKRRREAAEARVAELERERDKWRGRWERTDDERQRQALRVAELEAKYDDIRQEYLVLEEQKDELKAALREIERMAGAAGSGETPALPIASRARAALAGDGGGAIEPVDEWRIVDKWWTDSPERKYWITLRAPDGATASICYLGDGNWEIRELG